MTLPGPVLRTRGCGGCLASGEAEIAGLRVELAAEREARRRLELRFAELERRLAVDSSNSGTPSSKERIGAKEERRARQQSERERREDRKRGGQPGHPGRAWPGTRTRARSRSSPRRRSAAVQGRAGRRGPGRGGGGRRSWDVEIVRKVTEWALPGLQCPCCGDGHLRGPAPRPARQVRCPTGGAERRRGAADRLRERAAGAGGELIGMLLGAEVSAGWVDKASSRLSALLGKAGLDEAMLAALAGAKAPGGRRDPGDRLGQGPPAAGRGRRGGAGPGREGRQGHPPARRTSWSSAPRTGGCGGHRPPAARPVGGGIPAGFAGA